MSDRMFVEKWVLNERTGSVDREIDEVRSYFPPPSISGLDFFSGVLYATASAEFTTLLSVPSTRIFILRGLCIDNDYASPNAVNLYNYDAASTLSFAAYRVKVHASGTEIVNNLNVPFRGGGSGGVFMCTPQPSVWVRVTGILIASD